ncbi:MAG TPA: ABC transporter substrate-binding protein, partial [Steroidobacteraceae bacterium]|nr:ABC transporter substrate-binding protein [Steroidobacteraceae bacterium]
MNGFPASLGNPYRGNGRPGTLIWYALFDALTQLDERGELAPALASSWELVAPTRWRFQLRAGVRFADGTPFDAHAAAAVMHWLGSTAGRSTVIGNELRGVTAAHALSELVLDIETRDPDPILPKRMVGALMVEPRAWSRLGPDGFALQPIGTGPFLLQNWDQRTRRVHAVANTHSWRRTAHFTRLEFVELPESAARTQALLSQDVDISLVEIEELDRLEARGYNVIAAPAMSVMSLGFVTERATPSPLQDVRVRQALNLAVDRETMARTLLRGYGRGAGQPAASMSFGHDPELPPYQYDPQRARALLIEAGYPNGFAFNADVLINSFPADTLIYQSMAHYLRQIGVTVTLRVITFPQYLRNLQRNSFSGDAFGASWNSAPYNDATRPMESFSCNRPRPFFCDRALAAELKAASTLLVDERRLDAMRKLARSYRESAPA